MIEYLWCVGWEKLFMRNFVENIRFSFEFFEVNVVLYGLRGFD